MSCVSKIEREDYQGVAATSRADAGGRNARTMSTAIWWKTVWNGTMDAEFQRSGQHAPPLPPNSEPCPENTASVLATMRASRVSCSAWEVAMGLGLEVNSVRRIMRLLAVAGTIERVQRGRHDKRDTKGHMRYRIPKAQA